MEDGFSGTWCNSLFRMAVTAAKKVKTEMNLSGISVSTATLAVKAAEMYFRQSEGIERFIIVNWQNRTDYDENIAADHVQLYAASRQNEIGRAGCSGNGYVV